MTQKLLLKGFEVELFTGKSNGENVGIAAQLAQDLPDFVKEPDQRNIEYITSPSCNYEELKESLLSPRKKLREWLKHKDLTILPGSTLSLGNSKIFQRSDPLNLYHEFIEKTYGSTVVTSSIHINIGLENLELLFASLRLIRCEAALFLALSASSPFLDGQPTGNHSQRWSQFPRTPRQVPIFLNHIHYVNWVEKQLSNGSMKNERHLWTSVRPNGPNRPYGVNRLELRICDLMSNCDVLIAVTALIELRILNLLRCPQSFDPLIRSNLSNENLAELCNSNDLAASKSSLNAKLNDWTDGKLISCRTWIEKIIEEVTPLAQEMNMMELLTPIYTIISEGNESIKWLKSFSDGHPIEKIMQKGIAEMQEEESSFSIKKNRLHNHA